MVTPGEVERYVAGALQLARNDPRGFARLDLSADGFWRSFAAILYAVPAFIVSWVNYRHGYVLAAGTEATTGLGFYTRLALIDIANWLVPLLIVGFVAAPLGLSANFGRWVIATNWLSLPIAYMMAFPVALALLAPGWAAFALIASLMLFALAIAAFFRVTRLAFDGDLPVAIAITAGMVMLSLSMTAMLQSAFGIGIEPVSG